VVASEEGHTEIVALLLKTKGIDVNEGVSDIFPVVSAFSAISHLHPSNP